MNRSTLPVRTAVRAFNPLHFGNPLRSDYTEMLLTLLLTGVVSLVFFLAVHSCR